MTDRELMQMALDAIEGFYPSLTELHNAHTKTAEALRARLAQPEPEPVAHSVVAGALFDFMGWLTSRKERIVLSSADNASPAVEVITEFAKRRGLSLNNAKVQDWHTAQPQREWQGLTEYEVGFLTVFDGLHDVEVPLLANFIRHIEAKLREKNA